MMVRREARAISGKGGGEGAGGGRGVSVLGLGARVAGGLAQKVRETSARIVWVHCRSVACAALGQWAVVRKRGQEKVGRTCGVAQARHARQAWRMPGRQDERRERARSACIRRKMAMRY